MASIQKHGKRWRAQVAMRGTRKSKVFPTRQEARDWAARTEAELAAGQSGASRLPFHDLLDRYARTVSPTKRGYHWEVARIEKWKAGPLASKRLCDLSQPDFAEWRDQRLVQVAPGTVRREMNLLKAIFSQARKEWRLIDASPMEGLRMPQEPPKRDRLPTQAEIDALVFVAGPDLSTDRARSVQAFLFAIETGMRAGEICGLTRADVVGRVATLPRTKNGEKRQVPLSARALEILDSLPDADPLFGLTSRALDAAFRAVKSKASVSGLTFHDSRHAAVTRLSRVLDPLALAKMIGHRDLKMLMRYYDEAPEAIAARLDGSHAAG